MTNSTPDNDTQQQLLAETRRLREAQEEANRMARKQSSFSLGRVFAALVLLFVIFFCLVGFVV